MKNNESAILDCGQILKMEHFHCNLIKSEFVDTSQIGEEEKNQSKNYSFRSIFCFWDRI